MRLSSTQLQFLARIAMTPDGKVLVDLLQALLRERDAKLRTSTGEEVFRQQGRALEIAELIDDFTQSQKRLERAVSPQTSAVRHVA
jgi:hypothetical protein